MVMEQAGKGLIQQAELGYEAKRLGLSVSDREVQDELQNGLYKPYLFPDGKWIGQKQYEALLSQNGSSVQEFERSDRDGLLHRKLISTISARFAVIPEQVGRT